MTKFKHFLQDNRFFSKFYLFSLILSLDKETKHFRSELKHFDNIEYI